MVGVLIETLYFGVLWLYIPLWRCSTASFIDTSVPVYLYNNYHELKSISVPL